MSLVVESRSLISSQFSIEIREWRGVRDSDSEVEGSGGQKVVVPGCSGQRSRGPEVVLSSPMGVLREGRDCKRQRSVVVHSA